MMCRGSAAEEVKNVRVDDTGEVNDSGGEGLWGWVVCVATCTVTTIS